MALRHGSHPCHGFEELAMAPPDRHCTVCMAMSDGSEVRWFACVAPQCDFLLCEKCFNVKEELLDTPQVMIRNPMLDYDDTDAAIRTRPRPGSYCLSMLYGGRLMRVLSSATDEADPAQVYFRIASGGWIKKAHVVCVQPHNTPSMRLLTDLHQSSRKLGPEIADGAVKFDVLCELMEECMETIDDNEAYGIVMSALVMYPLLSTVEVPLRAFRVAVDPLPMVDFVHFVLHFVLTRLVERMDLEELQFDFRLADSTMAPLYGDVLARCLHAAYCLSCNWKVRLPSSFAYLVSRALAAMERLRLLLRADPLDQPPVLCAPAVTVSHASLASEKQRLCRLFLFMTDVGGRLLQQCIKDTRLDLSVLQPIRDQLCSGCLQSLSKVFCEALATMAEADLLRVQRTYLHIDALEVVGSLAATATLAESQKAVYRVVQLLAAQCPRNIALVSAVLLEHLLEMLMRAQSPAAYVAAMDCFFEMAFNDPRFRAAEVGAAEVPQPQPRACTARAMSPATGGTSGVTPTKASTPYQLLCAYRMPNGTLVPLCAYCSAHHPPVAGELIERAQYAYFQCQCSQCAVEASRPSSCLVPQPAVPLTAAQQTLVAQLPDKVLALAGLLQIPQALNALGRVLLRVPPHEEVLLRMLEELVRYPSLEAVPYAALVVKANAHLPVVSQRLAGCTDTAVGRYVYGPFDVVTPAKNYVDETPAKSHPRSEFGLSASPYTRSTVQSGSLYDMRGALSSSTYLRDSSRGIQLFGAGASTEE